MCVSVSAHVRVRERACVSDVSASAGGFGTVTAVPWLLDAPCEAFILCAFRPPATMNLAQQPELSLAAGQGSVTVF